MYRSTILKGCGIVRRCGPKYYLDYQESIQDIINKKINTIIINANEQLIEQLNKSLDVGLINQDIYDNAVFNDNGEFFKSEDEKFKYSLNGNALIWCMVDEYKESMTEILKKFEKHLNKKQNYFLKS